MRKPTGPLDYQVTTHQHLSGCRLSLAGQWGNVPHRDVEAAETAARAHAAGQPLTISHRAHGAPKR